MEGLRRSTRKRAKVNYAEAMTPSYPEGQPKNEFERRIDVLNKQTFPLRAFSSVDDALVYSLFGSKRRTSGYRTLIPERAFREEGSAMTKEEGIMIRHIYQDWVEEGGLGLEGRIEGACDSMVEALPEVFSRDKLPILAQ